MDQTEVVGAGGVDLPKPINPREVADRLLLAVVHRPESLGSVAFRAVASDAYRIEFRVPGEQVNHDRRVEFAVHSGQTVFILATRGLGDATRARIATADVAAADPAEVADWLYALAFYKDPETGKRLHPRDVHAALPFPGIGAAEDTLWEG